MDKVKKEVKTLKSAAKVYRGLGCLFFILAASVMLFFFFASTKVTFEASSTIKSIVILLIFVPAMVFVVIFLSGLEKKRRKAIDELMVGLGFQKIDSLPEDVESIFDDSIMVELTKRSGFKNKVDVFHPYEKDGVYLFEYVTFGESGRGTAILEQNENKEIFQVSTNKYSSKFSKFTTNLTEHKVSELDDFSIMGKEEPSEKLVNAIKTINLEAPHFHREYMDIEGIKNGILFSIRGHNKPELVKSFHESAETFLKAFNDNPEA